MNWRKIIFPVKIILFIVFIYLGLSALVSVDTRMFTIVVPMLLIWIAFIFHKSVRINLKFDNDSQTGVTLNTKNSR